MKGYFLGIDCGLDGAMVMIDDRSNIISKYITPTVKMGKGRELDILASKNIFDDIIALSSSNIKCAIEDPGGHAPSAAGLRSMTYCYAIMRTLVCLSQFPHLTILSQKWQKEFWSRPKLAKGVKFNTKAAALKTVNQIFPSEDFRKNSKCSIPHDGIVDALLLAEYARRVLG